jgi:signal transduction histidine kinase
MDDAASAPLARRLWLVGEPIHALTYFAQPSFDAWTAAGIHGFWRGYFATRAAPFGAAGPELVTAAFYGFEPAMVARALPSVWELATPAAALEARLAGMDASLHGVVGAALGDDALRDPAIAATAATLREVVDAAALGGRALFAANAALPWPTEPHLALWHGLTCLREHRGDGHNAALVAAGIDGCQAHVLAGAAGGAPREVTQPTRGWTDGHWDAATADLAERGILDAAGAITDDGRRVHADVEARTDQLAAAPWARLGPDRAEQVRATLLPWARAIQAAGTIRQPNPMGLPPLD